ncbi:MAG: endonuclease/exonuclease/phosphatase family protein, partial [Lentisphaerae bacterium]|nr:endonuclease/exonuclease/phosphatase family protein [Lentisphaerota bacterium]
MKILTCNVRCFGAKDGPNDWSHRKDLCARVIHSRAPDIICFQELWAEQYADLAAAFPGYATFGMFDEPLGSRPMNGIFFRADAFESLVTGGYWLSETPHVPGSKSWESACVRQANWIRLKDRATGAMFRVVNTHLDHISQPARENQARLIVEDASAYPPDFPQLLTGDMNCDCTNAAIATFKESGWFDTYGKVHGTENPGHTFHAFRGPEYHSAVGKMDWIFAKGALHVLDAEIIKDSEGGRFPS